MFCAFSAIYCNVHTHQQKAIHVTTSVLCYVFKNMVKKSQLRGEKEGKQILITNSCNSQILVKVKTACCIRLDGLEGINLMACIQCIMFLMSWASLFSGIPWSAFSACEERNKFYRHYILSIKCLNYFIFIQAMMQDRRNGQLHCTWYQFWGNI